MTGLEICLVIIGLIVVACSYLFAEGLQNKDKKEVEKMIQGEEKKIAGVDVAAITEEVVRQQVDIAVDDVLDEAVEKTEIVLDKLTNEKIMAVNEYSDGVLGEINKNHSEVMFLYNMLNDKEKTIKDTVREVEAVKRSIKQIGTAKGSEKLLDMSSGTYSSGIPLEEAEKNELKKIMENDFPEPMNEDENRGNHNQEILNLFQQGMSNLEIAKQLGLGMGEVRLVIDLYKDRM